jgi:hypothetical protein
LAPWIGCPLQPGAGILPIPACLFECGSGGIGRRASLRSLLPQGSGGSSPLFRTSLRSPADCRAPRGATAGQAPVMRRLSRRSRARNVSSRSEAKADHHPHHVRTALSDASRLTAARPRRRASNGSCAGSVRGWQRGAPEVSSFRMIRDTLRRCHACSQMPCSGSVAVFSATRWRS